MEEVRVSDKHSDGVITSKHAILINQVHDFSYGDYLRAVGDCVGPSNICSIGKCNGKIKIYLHHLTHVKSIVSSGIQIGGRQLTVDYNDPNSTKLLLLNVQTEIPNSILEKKLSLIGKVVSNITTMTVDIPDPDYAHVLSDTRSVYVKVDPKIIIPHSFEIAYDGQQFEIFIQQEFTSALTEATELDYPKGYLEQNFHLLNCKGSSKKSNGRSASSTSAALSRKRGRPPSKHLKEKIVVNTSKQKSGRVAPLKKKGRQYIKKVERYTNVKSLIKRKRGRKKVDSASLVSVFNYNEAQKTDISNTDITNESGTFISEDNSSKLPEATMALSVNNNGNDSEVLSDAEDIISFQVLPHHPLDLETLLNFLKEAKNNRNPFELAIKMLEDNNSPGHVNDLCDELIEYYKYTKESSLKNRIYRLVPLLSSGHKEAA